MRGHGMQGFCTVISVPAILLSVLIVVDGLSIGIYQNLDIMRMSGKPPDAQHEQYRPHILPTMINANVINRQGTWQFMSAGLVAGNQTQDNRDDLESSLYTLLWVAVMYLKCPNPDRVVGLLNEIFEPHPGIRVTGSKEDFLQGRSFLKVKLFPDPPALFKLVRGLAVLFASRYHDGDEPSNTQETGDANSSPTSTTSVSEYNQRTSSQLIDHSAVIKLFDAALQDRSEWPVNDAAERQQYHGSKKVLDGLELKTGWCTIQYVETSKDVEMKDAQNEDAL
jgi:hypothetical protein